jgi:hypothetical protein
MEWAMPYTGHVDLLAMYLIEAIEALSSDGVPG